MELIKDWWGFTWSTRAYLSTNLVILATLLHSSHNLVMEKMQGRQSIYTSKCPLSTALHSSELQFFCLIGDSIHIELTLIMYENECQTCVNTVVWTDIVTDLLDNDVFVKSYDNKLVTWRFFHITKIML